jgi:hypothetical protein
MNGSGQSKFSDVTVYTPLNLMVNVSQQIHIQGITISASTTATKAQ